MEDSLIIVDGFTTGVSSQCMKGQRMHARFVEKLRYIHRNPVRRGLVAKPEDWRWPSYRHYQTGTRGDVEIESEWTARHRGWQLPEWMRYRQLGSSSPVPKREGPGAPST